MGLAIRCKRLTTRAKALTNRSTSSRVVFQPKLTRTMLKATSDEQPMAVRT